MSRISKFLALSGAEKSTFLAALSGLPMIRIRLRLLGFRKCLARLQRASTATVPSNLDVSTYAAQTSRLVNAAARLLFRGQSCLERSIMLWSLLQRKGIKSDLKIGVATDEPAFQAHAWVEIGGVRINEPLETEKKFTPFKPSFPADKDLS